MERYHFRLSDQTVALCSSCSLCYLLSGVLFIFQVQDQVQNTHELYMVNFLGRNNGEELTCHLSDLNLMF